MAIERREGPRGVRYRAVFYSPKERKNLKGTWRQRKSDALDDLAIIRKSYLDGVSIKAREDVVFRVLSAEFMATVTGRESTKADYQRAVNRLDGFFGDLPLSRITPKLVHVFVAKQCDVYKPRTVRKTVTRLRQILKAGARFGYVECTAAKEIDNLPAIDDDRVRLLTKKQVHKLLEKVEAYYRPMLMLAVTSGLRRSELFGLTWECVDLTAGTVTVKHQLNGRDLVPPKSAAARRTVHIPTSVCEALRSHQDRCPYTEQDLCFPTPYGAAHQHPSNFLRDVWRPALKAAKLEGFTLHDLRHTYASTLIRNGASLELLRKMVGHADVTTTIRVYGHLLPDEGEKAAVLIGEAFDFPKE